MANKSGMDRLREAAGQTKKENCKICVAAGMDNMCDAKCNNVRGMALRAICKQIEAEHLAEINEMREAHGLLLHEVERKRELTQEAREVVERLRKVDPRAYDGCNTEEYSNSLNDFGRAVCGSLPGVCMQDVVLSMRDRLCELLEHGGKQDVDVADLLALADEFDAMAYDDEKCVYDVTKRIRKAVDGAQKPDAVCEDAFSWVEARVELDKLLMPEYMEWPAWSDGLPVTRDDAPESVTAVCLALDGSCYSLHYDMPEDERMVHSETGERVKRPEPEVLGADGKPIKVGETVYSKSRSRHIIAEVHHGECPDDSDMPWVRYENGGWDRAAIIAHTLPDTQERLDSDAGAFCCNCIQYDGEHGTTSCGDIPSLLRRQRELCAKGGEK